MSKVKIIFVIFFLSFSTMVSAGIIHVPGDQPTIQAGIDAAANDDTVLVADGTYTGTGNRDIDFNGKGITVRSENGADYCIIDCEGSDVNPHRGFYFHGGEQEDSIVHGFTIQNGYAVNGGGIKCSNFSSPTISGNIIRNNHASNRGGGIYCINNANATITNNMVILNTVDEDGGGIFCENTCPVIKNNYICWNTAPPSYGLGGGIYCDSSKSMIANNTICGNSALAGGGILCDYHFAGPDVTVIDNNLVFGNTAEYAGGGIMMSWIDSTMTNNTVVGNACGWGGGGGILAYEACELTISNTILWNNQAAGGGIELHVNLMAYNSSIVTISYSDVKGGLKAVHVQLSSTLNWGDGMIKADPLFIDPENDDFHLRQTPCQIMPWGMDNPCVDAGDPVSEKIRGTTRTDGVPDSGIVDMGYHYPPYAWTDKWLEEIPD